MCRDKPCTNLPGAYICGRGPSPISEKPRPQLFRDQASNSPPCPPGMKHWKIRGCVDIDECQKDPDICPSNEECINIPESFICKCKPGFERDNNVMEKCVDIDECQKDPEVCTSSEQCINTPGSFICKCKPGFERDNNVTEKCVDKNECQPFKNDCLATQRCENTPGGYRCVTYLPCNMGYTLNANTGNCEDENECVLGTHKCTGDYHCRNTLGSYKCDRNYRTTAGARMLPVTSKIGPTTFIPSAIQSSPRKCPRGFEVNENGQCIDMNECQRSPNHCAGSYLQKCVTTVGSFRYFFSYIL